MLGENIVRERRAWTEGREGRVEEKLHGIIWNLTGWAPPLNACFVCLSHLFNLYDLQAIHM